MKLYFNLLALKLPFHKALQFFFSMTEVSQVLAGFFLSS